MLTLDALNPQRFAEPDLDTLEAFASLAAATDKASERIQSLTRRAEDERALAGSISAPPAKLRHAS